MYSVYGANGPISSTGIKGKMTHGYKWALTKNEGTLHLKIVLFNMYWFSASLYAYGHGNVDTATHEFENKKTVYKKN